MGNGYVIPASDPIDQLMQRFRELERRLSETEAFTGAELFQTVQTLQDLVDGLLSQTDINATGNAEIGGTIHSVGRGTFDGGITSADVNTRILSFSYDSVYIDGNNIFGLSPSSRRYKQDIVPADLDPNLFYLAEIVNYRTIEAVEKSGEAAKVEIGGIAEQFHDIGLGQFVRYDSEGRPDGITYERLTVGLIAVVQQLNNRIKQLEEGN